jgi:hypothetical protein
MKYLKPYKLYESHDDIKDFIIYDSLVDLEDHGLEYSLPTDSMTSNDYEEPYREGCKSFRVRIKSSLYDIIDDYMASHNRSEDENKVYTCPSFKWKDVVGSITELVSQLSDYYKLDNCIVLYNQYPYYRNDPYGRFYLVYENGKWMREETASATTRVPVKKEFIKENDLEIIHLELNFDKK